MSGSATETVPQAPTGSLSAQDVLAGQVAAEFAAEAKAKEATSQAPEGQETPQAEGPDLSDLPGRIRETLSKLPADVAAAYAETYRKDLLAPWSRDKQELAKKEKQFESRLRNAEIAERIFSSDNPEARRKFYEAAEAASGRAPAPVQNGHEEDADEAADLWEAKDGKEFTKGVASLVERLVERRLAAMEAATQREQAERLSAIQAEANALRDSFGDKLTDEEFDAAWQKAVDSNGSGAFRPGRVAALVAPEIVAVLTGKQVASAKPIQPRPGRPASVAGQTDAATPSDVPPWIKRGEKGPKGGEIVDDVLRGFGLTPEGLRDLQRPGARRFMPPP